jgi:hypothetical protein
MVTMQLSDLVFDYEFYPRTEVDSTHVNRMIAADKAGVKFPDYIIDKSSKRVIDGFHRGKKDKILHGPDCQVHCTEKEYRNEGEMFLDAMRLNAHHGRPLSPFDRARCALKCRKYKVSMKLIASALNMTLSDLKAIGEGRTAKTSGNGKGHEVALKQTIKHKAGETLTSEQEQANKKLSGMNQVFYANQLLLLAENELLDTSDDILMTALRKLYKVLSQIL